jgi:hypothetical protein
MQQDTLPPFHSNYLFFQTFWSNLFQILVNILPFIFSLSPEREETTERDFHAIIWTSSR